MTKHDENNKTAGSRIIRRALPPIASLFKWPENKSKQKIERGLTSDGSPSKVELSGVCGLFD